MKEIRRIIKPIFYINQPKLLLELGAVFLGTETELILKSRNVIPQRLSNSGFKFKYARMEDIVELDIAA